MPRLNLSSEFLQYLATQPDTLETSADPDQLPSLSSLSEQLSISVASLREQVEVAKALGLVEVRPRTGMRRLPFSFLPAVRESLTYALVRDRTSFYQYAELRNHIEAAYWNQAVESLTAEDHQLLRRLMENAWTKLRGSPIRIPHDEHRQLHMAVYSRLGNVFVQGILEAYWEAYEQVGLNVYTDLEYLQTVWTYHQAMVDAICAGDPEAGFRALVEHKGLLYHRLPEDQPGHQANNGLYEPGMHGD